MNKLTTILILGIFMISFTTAFDSELTQTCGGDSELIIECIGDSELNSLGYEVTTEEGEGKPSGGGMNISGIGGGMNYFYYYIFFILLIILICLFILLAKKKKKEE